MAYENSWMIESMVQFMQCPEWVSPVQQFIDTNCIVFDTEEESKLEFTDIHNHFKKLCEELLEGFLAEIGIPLETFVAVAADASRNPTNLHGHAATQVLEYLMCIDDFISFKHMMEKRNVMLELEVMEELQAQAEGGNRTAERKEATQAELDEEEELRMAIEASLAEFEAVQQKSRELDDAELQQALKLSEEISKIAPPPAEVPPPPPSVVRKQEEEKVKRQATPPPEPAPAPTPVPAPAPLAAKPAVAALDEPKQRTLAALTDHRGGGFGQRSVLPGFGAGAPLGQKPVLGQAPTAPAPAPVTTSSAVAASTANVSSDEIAKRAAYMKAQKERIIQAKNEQRQKDLTEHLEAQGKKLKEATEEKKMSPEEIEAMQKRLAVAQRFREDLVQVTREARKGE